MGKAESAAVRQATELPALGSGLGYRRVHRGELFLDRRGVDFLGVVADHFMSADPAVQSELALLQAHFPLIPHGLDLSLGSAEGLDPAYLDRLAGVVEAIDPPWWSEHIAYTHADGVAIGHLAALPLTREALDVLCANIHAAQRRIPAPLILENITTPFRLPGDELTEPQFLTELTERTGCGLLLDVTNIIVNAANLGFDPAEYLDQLPLERVVQTHYVGWARRGDTWVDDHGSETPEPVWELLAEVATRCPLRGMVLERDRNIPTLAALRPELERAREIGRKAGRWD